MTIDFFLDMINPYLDTIGFIITLATFMITFQVNKQVSTAFERQAFYHDFQKILGDFKSCADLIAFEQIDSIDLLQQRLQISTHRLQTNYSFFSHKTIKATRTIHDFDYARLNHLHGRTELIEKIDSLIASLIKEYRE